MDHVKILKRALQITWKYRTLWLIGLLLVLVGGGVTSQFPVSPGNPGDGGGDGDRWGDDWGYHRDFDSWPEAWEEIGPVLIAVGVVLLAVFVLVLVLSVVKAVLRYVTRGSLIQAVDRYEETGEELRFGAAFRLGWNRSAFRLFLISLMLKLPIGLLMFALIVPAVAFAIAMFVGGSGPRIALGVMSLLLIIPVSLLGIVLGLAVRPVVEVAYRACTLRGLGAWEAIKFAFGLIRRNLGAVALQWLLLVGLGIAWRMALMPVNLVLMLVGLPLGGLSALLFGGLSALAFGVPWGIGAGVLVLIPILLVVFGLPNLALTTAATVYHSTVWTLAYRELMALDEGDQETEWSAPVKADA